MKGGQLLTAIHKYTLHGDPSITTISTKILKETSLSFYVWLKKWCFEGICEDYYDEFFIDATSDGGADEWRKTGSVRLDMVPVFVGQDLVEKIDMIGKSLNFIRYVCKDPGYKVSSKDESLIDQGNSISLNLNLIFF